MIVYDANDHAVRFSNGRTISLTTGEVADVPADAVVQFRIQTAAYVDVGGETWPITMSHITGSHGNFIGVLRKEVEIESGVQYRFIGTVDAGDDQEAYVDIPLDVVGRRS